eukprot:g14359.t1
MISKAFPMLRKCQRVAVVAFFVSAGPHRCCPLEVFIASLYLPEAAAGGSGKVSDRKKPTLGPVEVEFFESLTADASELLNATSGEMAVTTSFPFTLALTGDPAKLTVAAKAAAQEVLQKYLAKHILEEQKRRRLSTMRQENVKVLVSGDFALSASGAGGSAEEDSSLSSGGASASTSTASSVAASSVVEHHGRGSRTRRARKGSKVGMEQHEKGLLERKQKLDESLKMKVEHEDDSTTSSTSSLFGSGPSAAESWCEVTYEEPDLAWQALVRIASMALGVLQLFGALGGGSAALGAGSAVFGAAPKAGNDKSPGTSPRGGSSAFGAGSAAFGGKKPAPS